MKKTISMLFTCAFAIAGCGPEDIAPTPTPAPTSPHACQKPRGAYALKGTILEVSPAPGCIQPQPGTDRSTTAPLQFDAEGNVVSNYKSYGVECTTAYTDDGCTVVAACSTTYINGTFGETHRYDLSADGFVLRGRYALAGTGAYCPRAVIEGTAQREVP